MAEFETIRPTGLLKSIRSDSVGDERKADATEASNFAYFLRSSIDFEVGKIKRSSANQLKDPEERERIAEIVMTGLQLMIEQKNDELVGFVSPGEPTVSE